jgi:O-acetylhomoserine/O-acetylserine sulfhydrylase-like pyridoxal-dependent enzyme
MKESSPHADTSVGLEHPADIIADIERALERSSA